MPTSHVIDNPYGKAFAHGLTGGNVLLMIVDHTGKNLSMPLSAEEAIELGRWLFFNHQDGLAIVVESQAPEEDDEEVYEVVQPAPSRPTPVKELSRGNASERQALVAKLYMSDEAETYESPGTGRKGKGIFVADTLGLTSKQAANLIQRAREAGLIPFVGSKGGGGQPTVWTQERLEEIARLYMLDEAAVFASPDGRGGRIAFVAARMGVTYNSANRAIGTARRKGTIPDSFRPGSLGSVKGRTKKSKRKNQPVSWTPENLTTLAALYQDPTSANYVSPRDGTTGRAARVADHFGITPGTASVAAVKARALGYLPPVAPAPAPANGQASFADV